jgi:hypothetical protein
MIVTTPDDIGRRVIYQPTNQSILEYGEITSYNNNYVFVKFEYTTHGIACLRENLEYDKEAKHHDYPTNPSLL